MPCHVHETKYDSVSYIYEDTKSLGLNHIYYCTTKALCIAIFPFALLLQLPHTHTLAHSLTHSTE